MFIPLVVVCLFPIDFLEYQCICLISLYPFVPNHILPLTFSSIANITHSQDHHHQHPTTTSPKLVLTNHHPQPIPFRTNNPQQIHPWPITHHPTRWTSPETNGCRMLHRSFETPPVRWSMWTSNVCPMAPQEVSPSSSFRTPRRGDDRRGHGERVSWGGAGEGRRGGDDVGIVWWLGEEDVLIQDVVSLKDM